MLDCLSRMSPSQLILADPIPWWFYAVLVGFIGFVGWIGFEATRAVRAVLSLGTFRKLADETAVSTKAVSTYVWLSALLRVPVFVFAAYGTWVMIRANYCSFRQLDVSTSYIRLTYQWSTLNREIPLATVRSIDLTHPFRRKFRLKIVTSDGRVYRGMDIENEAVVSDCQRLVENFRRK